MLRTVKMEDLPSYQRVLERGVDIGISQGIFETAIIMIEDFKIAIDDVVEKLNIKKEELLEYMKKKKN